MISKNKWRLLTVVALVAIAITVGLSEEIDWRAMRQSMESMNRVLLVTLVAVLPVFGFSIALVYLIVGAVFGGWIGLAVIGGATAVHLVGSHWIARSFLRAPLQRFLDKRKYRMPELPQGEEWAVVLMTALVPGLPYFVRNYLLALSDIPLRIYFGICWPVFVVRSALVIFLGDFSSDVSGQKVAILGTILAVKVAICAYLIHRLRKRSRVKARARVDAATALHARE